MIVLSKYEFFSRWAKFISNSIKQIWRVHNQKLELDSTYSAHKSKIYDLLLVGSTLCSASEEGTIKIWKIETDEHKQKYQLVHQQTFKGHQNSVLSLAYFNGFLLSGDASGYLKVSAHLD